MAEPPSSLPTGSPPFATRIRSLFSTTARSSAWATMPVFCAATSITDRSMTRSSGLPSISARNPSPVQSTVAFTSRAPEAITMSIQMSENNPTVRIDHEDAERKNILFVDWMLGNACNYACSYCPPALHDGTERWVPATTILTFAEAVTRHAARQHRKVVFQLSGGEVTAIPYFLETLRSLKALGIATLIISNGTKHLDWWEKAVPFLDAVVLTFHPERAVLDHFLRVVQMVSAGIRTHVNVAAPPERFDACVHVAETLANACTDITITPKPMLLGFSDKLSPYTPQQLEIL